MPKDIKKPPWPLPWRENQENETNKETPNLLPQ